MDNVKKFLPIILIICAVGVIFILIVTVLKTRSAHTIPSAQSPTPAPTSGSISSSTLSSTNVQLAFVPITQSFGVNETKSFDVLATFTPGSPSETIDYVKAVITFSPDYVHVSPNTPNPINQSGLSRVITMTSAADANANGKLVIELGAAKGDQRPPTNQPIKIATISFTGTQTTPSDQTINITQMQVVNSYSVSIPSSAQSATYSVR